MRNCRSEIDEKIANAKAKAEEKRNETEPLTNEFLARTYGMSNPFGGLFSFPDVRPRAVCADGFSISIQANAHSYCEPRQTGDGPYEFVELGFPSESDELIEEYAEDPSDYTGTVYGYVPVEVVDKLIEKHGGIVSPIYVLTEEQSRAMDEKEKNEMSPGE